METLHLKPEKHRRIIKGHLWAFAGEIAENLKDLKPGDAVALCESRGKLLGRGYVNPHSLIAVRLLTRGNEEWGKNLFEDRIRAAIRYREGVLPGAEACRLIYSESDGLPGLIVDRYGEHLVMQATTAGIESRLDDVIDALRMVVKPKSIYLKAGSAYRELESLKMDSQTLYGEPPKEIVFRENGLWFYAHPQTGQKTGFFLDQRENRSLLQNLVTGRRILDLYCYTGAWGLSALKVGASEAVFVDSSTKAVEWGMEQAEENGVACRSLFVQADVEEYLSEAVKSGTRFDVVVVDPPALIPSRSAAKKGIDAYRAINRLAMSVVSPGGWLISCSCSHLLNREKHMELMGEAAVKLRRRARFIKTGGQAVDHPVLPGHPETEYLKCAIVHCA